MIAIQLKHTRRKHTIISAAIFLLFISSSKAGEQQQTYKSSHLVSDTLVNKDTTVSELEIPRDLKLGFKNLFVSSTLTNGINTAQLNPLAINFVQDYMNKNGKTMDGIKDWGKPYFDMMDYILAQHGLPKELKYLAVIESHLKATARSWVGAVGPWQFMPATARTFGLKVNKYFDERTDYFKSTHAASRYLTDLYAIYGDWLLVIAAYNTGPGNVNSAIRKAGSRDFWSLQQYLPAESRNHVKKFIATHYIMEGQGGITTITKDEVRNLVMANGSLLTMDEMVNTKIQPITGRYNSNVITKYITMNIATFNRMNPGFDTQIANEGKFDLRLPADKMDIFLAKKSEILGESVQLLLNAAN